MLSKINRAVIEAYKRGYRVNDSGEVISSKGHNVKLQFTGNSRSAPRPKFPFKFEGSKFPVPVHKLAAYQKYGDELFEVDCVRHKDGDEKNNSPDNLLLGSNSDNMMDKPKEQRVSQAKKAAKKLRKLSDDQVAQLRLDRENGASYLQLQRKYGIAKATISFIVNNKTYQ